MKYKEITDEKEIFDSEVVFGKLHKPGNIEIKQPKKNLADNESLFKNHMIITEGAINEKQLLGDLILKYRPLNSKIDNEIKTKITANGTDELTILNYFLSINLPLYIYNIPNDKTNYYSIVDNKEFFNEILLYGEKLYNILKNDLINVYPKNMTTSTTIDLIENSSISMKILQIQPIVLQFINDYSIPINQGFSEEVDTIAVRDIVNNIMLIYILNIIYTKLSKGYAKYKNAYHILDITNEYNDKEIIHIIVKFYNYATSTYNKLGTYQTRIISQKNNGKDIFIPIRYTTNLFTFAWSFFQNYICSSIVYEYNHDKVIDDNGNDYILYYRCPICLKTFSICKTVNTNFNKTPTFKATYCNQCSKRQRNINYENDIAKLYKQIKESLNNIDTTTDEGKQLYDEIKHLKAKYYYRNKKVLNELLKRIEHNKKR